MEDTDMGKCAYVYGRYSSHSQKDTSIEQQFHEIYDYCERNRIKIIGEYADRAVSGRTDRRPEFQRMIKDCAKGRAQYVVCWKVDRFARNRYDSATYKARLKKHGVTVLYAKESIPDGPEGILLESVLEGSAEYYSANLAQNIRRGMKENALACKVNSNPPLGYCKGKDGRFSIDPAGAAIVRNIFHMYANGRSITAIVAELNAQGFRTARGTKFNKNSLRCILQNKRYIGVYKFGEIQIENGVPPIISKELFDKVQEQRAKNAKVPASTDEYILTSKLFCGCCGSAMVGESGISHNGTKYNYYICSAKKRKKTCKKKTVKRDWVEDFVIRETTRYVLVDEVIEKTADAAIILQHQELEQGQLPVLKGQLSDVKKTIRNVMNAIEQGILTPTTKQRLKELEERQYELESTIEQVSNNLLILSKEQIIFWLEKLRSGDLNGPSCRKKIINTFVNCVYLYDDRIKIVYNYSKNNHQTISFEWIDSLSSSKFDDGIEFGHGVSSSTIMH